MFSMGSEGMEGSGGRRRRKDSARPSGAATNRWAGGTPPGARASPSVALRPGVDLAGDREAQEPAGLLERPRVGPGMEPARAHDAAIRLLGERARLPVAGLAQGAHGGTPFGAGR